MSKKAIYGLLALFLLAPCAIAEEFDAVFNDASRGFSKQKKSAETIYYGKLTLDSKGKVVGIVYVESPLAKDVKVVMGILDEKKNTWSAGAAIEGGVNNDIFTTKGKTVQAHITLASDNRFIKQILVKKTDEPLAMADTEFDAILSQIGPQTNGNGAITYVRLDIDEKGNIVKKFARRSGRVTAETKVVMGKFNEKEKKWEPGDPVPNGLYGDIFKDLGAKTVYVRMTLRDDRRSFAQILVRQVGEKKN